MLNYIWGGLIVISLIVALSSDTGDILSDRYRNESLLPVTLEPHEGVDATAPSMSVRIVIASADYADLFNASPSDQQTEPEAIPAFFDALLERSPTREEVVFSADAPLPPMLADIREHVASRDGSLRAIVVRSQNDSDATHAATQAATVSLRFPPVRFVKLQAITSAAIQSSKTAVELALGLIGVLALWLGVVRIAEKGGLVNLLVRVIQPLLRPLFPQIPRDHPALGMIALNLAANVLGLGNAATPMGIKAMEELQKLNPEQDTATDSMVMLLAMNTASVQLVPPATLIALMGIQANMVIIPIIIVTFFSLIIAVTAAKLLGKLPMYRRTDPTRLSQ